VDCASLWIGRFAAQGRRAIALASDYVFRGISQTDNHSAIQGSLEYGYEPWSVYLGTWASSVNTMT
jgi:uncharacterized protein (TIGR02001 family)